MLTSVLSKCLEKRLHGNETAFPHPSQAAYQRSVSCANMIFFTQEAQLKFAREGDDVYLYLYDLEKAFDCLTLLSLLFERGSGGNSGDPSRVGVPTQREHYLSLSAFLDPSGCMAGICSLPNVVPCCYAPTSTYQWFGLSINGLTISSAAHADDIRSISNTTSDLQRHGEIIERFAQEAACANYQTLNPWFQP